MSIIITIGILIIISISFTDIAINNHNMTRNSDVLPTLNLDFFVEANKIVSQVC